MSNLIEAMAEVNDLNRTHGVTQRGGKKYTEVFVRVEAFRKAFGTDLGISTEVVSDDGSRVVMRARILDKNNHVIGSGYAEEIRGQGNVNKTSALENAETSAIGRALASLGLHGGTYASLNEIDAVQRKTQAMAQQPAPAPAPAPAPTTPAPSDAQAWCAKAYAEIMACNTREELQAWDDKNDLAIDALKVNHSDLFNQLLPIYTQKEKSFG
jgi:deoxycytidylate deaminase